MMEKIDRLAEMLTEIVLSEFEKGIKDIDTCEMGQVIDMLKDVAETKYYMTQAAREM